MSTSGRRFAALVLSIVLIAPAMSAETRYDDFNPFTRLVRIIRHLRHLLPVSSGDMDIPHP